MKTQIELEIRVDGGGGEGGAEVVDIAQNWNWTHGEKVETCEHFINSAFVEDGFKNHKQLLESDVITCRAIHQSLIIPGFAQTFERR